MPEKRRKQALNNQQTRAEREERPTTKKGTDGEAHIQKNTEEEKRIEDIEKHLKLFEIYMVVLQLFMDKTFMLQESKRTIPVQSLLTASAELTPAEQQRWASELLPTPRWLRQIPSVPPRPTTTME